MTNVAAVQAVLGMSSKPLLYCDLHPHLKKHENQQGQHGSGSEQAIW